MSVRDICLTSLPLTFSIWSSNFSGILLPVKVKAKWVFVENGLASKNELVKVLGTGELSDKINVTAHGFSASAKESIEAKGGTATIA